MKKMYQEKFKQLPAMRKCAPDDVRGVWKASQLLEDPVADETQQSLNVGPRYLGFGAHNRFFSFRADPKTTGASTLKKMENKTKLQYIVTTSGMIYIYRDNKFRYSQLCFVSEETKDAFSKGQLLVASPVVEGKPLDITAYDSLSAPKRAVQK